MKKIIILLMLISFLPINVFSKTYTLEDTDLKMELKKEWMIFTRDNIKNNKLLKTINVKYSMIKDYLDSNDIYLFGLLNYGEENLIKLIVRKTEIFNIYNLNKYNDEQISKFGKKVAKEKGADSFIIYGDKYKFIYLNYKKSDQYLMEFHTVVNSNVYSIKFKKTTKFNQKEKEIIFNMINNLTLKINENLEEPKKSWIL